MARQGLHHSGLAYGGTVQYVATSDEYLRRYPIEARIRVRLTPRAAHDEIVGWRGELLRVRVTAPPVGGRANAALERLLADALGVPKSAVRVVSGARAREKTVAIEGARQEEVLSRLPAKPPARLL